jgi:hypothetical protein
MLPEQSKRRRNPLFGAAFASFAVFLPPYHFHQLVDYMPQVAAAVFLGFYFFRSRFAWYILLIDFLLIFPLYTFLSLSWRIQIALHPRSIWFPIIATPLLAAFLFWSRERYFVFLKEEKQSEIDSRV